MKLASIFILAACLEVSANGMSQTITFSGKNVPLEKVFEAVRMQTSYNFFYDADILQEAKPVTIKADNLDLESFLSALLKDQPLKYSIKNKNIIISRKTAPPPPGSAVSPDQGLRQLSPVPVSGEVLDAEEKPLPGATVAVKGGKSSATTDANGRFSLNVSAGDVLLVSYVGYEPTEYKITSAMVVSSGQQPNPNAAMGIIISLKRNNSPLDEVQVIAYGTTTRRLNTGDVSTVNAKEMENSPVSNPLEALEGRVPGMLITQQTGVPGGGVNVQIRGQNSIAQGNNPLFVIDGVPYTSTLLPSIGSNILGGSNTLGTVGNPFNYINLSDIESVDILKDADATAIYGSRGANGVVLITTKKGKVGKSKMEINLYSGTGKVTRTMNLLNTAQYLQVRHEAFKNDGATPALSNGDYDLLSWDTSRYTDWQKLLIGGAAHYTDAQASLYGGNANTQFSIGSGYHRETTVFPGNFSDQKVNVHLGVISTSPDQKFKVQLSAEYMIDNNKLPNIDLTSQILSLPPNAPPVHNPDGTLNWANSTWPSGFNPFSFLQRKYNDITNNLISNGLLTYKIARGVELRAGFGYTNMQSNEVATFPLSAHNPFYNPTTGTSSFANNNIRSWIIEPQGSYQVLTGNGRGKVDFLLGMTFQQNTNLGQTINASGFSSDNLLGNPQAASSLTAGVWTNTQYKYNAGFGRLSYNWVDKYLLDLTVRRDGSSRFGPDKHFGNFGAAGAAWIFSKETVIQKKLPFLSFGKLRTSYGTTGNDQIGDYKYLDLYGSAQYPYQGSQGLIPGNLFNSEFAWEINKKLEAGLELGFIKDRILLSASYYRNRSSNQLVGYTLPSIAGFTTITANLPATVQNTGLEITLNTTNVKAGRFIWKSALNFTIPRNELLAFPNLASSAYAHTYVVGQPLSIVKVFHVAGVDPQTGQYQFENSKGLLTFSPSNPGDANTIVNMSTKFYGGLQNTIEFKGLELNIFFQFVTKIAPNYQYYLIVPPGTEGYNQPVQILNRWQKSGDIKPVERFNQNYNLYTSFSYAQRSDQAYSDASFIRLKNFSLSYQLPNSLKQKMHLQSCRIYIQGQNLFTITKYIGYDPENTSSTVLPPLRVLTFGILMNLQN